MFTTGFFKKVTESLSGRSSNLGDVHKWGHPFFDIFDPSQPLVTLSLKMLIKQRHLFADPLPLPKWVMSFMDGS